MQLKNSAKNASELTFYSSVPIINHPQKIIDECLQQISENQKLGKAEDVYSEIVIEGFNPIGIFCFTDGSKELNYMYQKAYELKEHFPDLEVIDIDLMNLKQDEELSEMQLQLINKIVEKTGGTLNYKLKDLDRFELFLNGFRDLKKSNDFTEQDIINLYSYNLKLLSVFDKDPNILFSGEYSEEEIKYILGKNVNYNIDYILKGDLNLYSIENLVNKLSNVTDDLNKYYDGLKEFLQIISNIQLTEEDIMVIKNRNHSNFYGLIKALEKTFKTRIDKDKNSINLSINKKENELAALLEEQRKIKENMEKYDYFMHINIYSSFIDFISKDYNDLLDELNKLTKRKEEISSDKNKALENLKEANSQKINIENQEYKNTLENKEINKEISELEKEIELLKKHPFINRKKIKELRVKLEELNNKNRISEKLFDESREEQLIKLDELINQLDFEINNCEVKLEFLEADFQSLIDQQKNLSQKLQEYYNCQSIEEAEGIIKEAQEFLKNYNDLESLTLYDIEQRINQLMELLEEEKNKMTRLEHGEDLISRSI